MYPTPNKACTNGSFAPFSMDAHMPKVRSCVIFAAVVSITHHLPPTCHPPATVRHHRMHAPKNKQKTPPQPSTRAESFVSLGHAKYITRHKLATTHAPVAPHHHHRVRLFHGYVDRSHHSRIGDISFLAEKISGTTPTSVPGGRNSDT
jgi:hypothetical protein